MAFKFFERHYKLSGLIAIVGSVGIFLISSLSFERGGGGSSLGFLSYLYHFLAFFLLCLFLLFYFVRGERKSFFIVAFLASLGYALSDEIHQYFVPGRFCSGVDVLIDLAGIVLALLIYGIVFVYRKN